MRPMKTPGVYIVEKNAFPNSVVQVATAVPAFVGYTEFALNGKKPLTMKPWRISSLAEFHQFFGGASAPMFELVERGDDPAGADFDLTPAAKDKRDPMMVPAVSVMAPDGEDGGRLVPKYWDLVQKTEAFALYGAMRLFFQNGGGACYVVSVGSYADEITEGALILGIDTLVKETEPTMLVVPETTRLIRAGSQKVQQKMVQHCGLQMRNRFAILDLFAGYRDVAQGDPVTAFRNDIGINQLDFAAAYYPWVNTSVFAARDFSYLNILPKSRKTLMQLMKRDIDPLGAKPANLSGIFAEIDLLADGAREAAEAAEAEKPEEERVGVPGAEDLDKTMRSIVPVYAEMMNEIADRMNCMPPGAAMAGIYTMVDNTRGVWKAPANVSLNAVVSPTVNISHDDQEDLNVTPQGKSINAIRPFVGEGTLVWGARTLDGNSLDWRYINVRRTMIMIEESIRLAAKAYVFEPNTANTWITMRSMIENFLNGIWKQGGLAGAVPSDAFSVHVGLGETMTPVDILEGILRITVLVAVTRPAEFIEITFQQQMQKS
ncbi:MAG: phage tail sheath family protein [Alkalilacustris sp.]